MLLTYENVTAEQPVFDSAVGPHSPFMLLPVYRGKLLFIGDILESCTFMHGIEGIVKPPYLRYEGKTRYLVNGE